MTSEPKEPKDLGIEIAPSRVYKLWSDIIDKVKKDIEMDKDAILINSAMLEMAKKKLKQEKDLYTSKDKV